MINNSISKLQSLLALASMLMLAAQLAGQEPGMPDFRSLSVDPASGMVVLKWRSPKPSENVLLHEVSRKQYVSDNYFFADPVTATVVMPDTVYSETVANIETLRQTYRIRSKNSENTSAITDAYMTMMFLGEYDACLNQINLRWTEYKRCHIDNATGQIRESLTDQWDIEAHNFNLAVEYEVWGYAGDPGAFDISKAVQLTRRGRNTQDVILPDPTMNYTLITDTAYLLFVKALLPNGDTATSHLCTIETANRRMPATFNIDSIIAERGILHLYFNLDKRTELDTFALYRSDITNKPIQWFYKSSDVTRYEDRDVSFGGIYSYNLVAFRCGKRVLTSDTASNIRVYATPDGQKAKLVWTSVPNEPVYTLTRVAPPPVHSRDFASTSTEYLDESIADSLCQGPKKFCYYIESLAPTADGNTTYSRSDTSCITLEKVITLPDAIDPKSDVEKTHECNCTPDCTYTRNLFGPVMDMDEHSYRLTIEIFDRGGVYLFGSRKPFDEPLVKSFYFWDGRYNGAYVNAGAYVYSVTLEFKNRSPLVLRGTVMVVYKNKQ